MTRTAQDLLALQISDLHLRGEEGARLLGVDTWATLGAVLDQALEEGRPDVILVTGDVAHDPEPAVYQRFHDHLRARYAGPVLMLPGNHDVLDHMGTLFERRCLELAGWTLLGLDSHVDEQPGALVDEAECEWLKGALAGARTDHVLLATHHPPVPVGCPWLDGDRIQNGFELLEWMSEHSTVRAMVFGHAHQEVESAHHCIALYGAPATCFQFEPGSGSFSVDGLMPGYRWLELGADGGVSSRVRRVEGHPLTVDLSQFSKE